MSASVTSFRSTNTTGQRDKFEQVASKLRALARHLKVELDDEQLRRYIGQLFNPGSPVNSDEVHSTVNRALRHVQRCEGTDPQVAAEEQARCAELVSRAVRSTVSRRPASFLTFASQYSKLHNNAMTPGSKQKTLDPREVVGHRPLEDMSNSRRTLRPEQGVRNPDDILPTQTPHGKHVSRHNPATPQTTPRDRKHDSTPVVPEILGRTPRERQEYAESILVRDVLFAFQGIEGHFIKFAKSTSSGGQFVPVTASTSISLPMRDLASRLCEMGWLFQHVSKHIRQIQKNPQLGVVSQCFAYTLQDELTEYFRFIAVLEAQNDTWQSNSDDNYVASRVAAAREFATRQHDSLLPLSDDNQPMAKPQSKNTTSRLSLRRLYVWSHDPMRRLRLMAEIVDSVGSLGGGALASACHSFTNHGDEFVSSFVERLMRCIAVPIFRWIRQWVFYGELVDVNNEFFVKCVPGVSLDRMWFDGYQLNSSMIPAFIGNGLAREIMLIGKTLIFVRQCCKSTSWLDKSTATEIDQGQQEFEYKTGQGVMGSDSQTAPLVVAIRRVGERTNFHLRKLLFEEFHLLRHCRALKQYLLLGQGDMIQYLMDLLSDELDKPASKIHRHNLSGQLETAIRASNASNDPEDVIQRLDVRILEASPGDCGWDVFLLTYRLDQPLNSVVTSEAMQRYHQIFKFLWKLKRVEYTLSIAWKKHTTAAHELRDVLDIHMVTHPSNLLRNEMIHFASNLHSYIMFEVLETSWNDLERDLSEATDLDCIIQAHDRYLNSVLNKTLIGSQVHDEDVDGDNLRSRYGGERGSNVVDASIDIQLLRERLDVLFNLVIRFCEVQDQLYDRALGAARDNREAQVRAYRRAQEGLWGDSPDHPKPNLELIREDICDQFESEIQNIASDYHESLKMFLAMLQPASSENLRFLTFRLDFNLYYTSNSESP